MRRSVELYQKAAMGFEQLSLASPDALPDDARTIQSTAEHSFNEAQDLGRIWTRAGPEQGILRSSQFHSYRRILSRISYLIHLYADVTPWISGPIPAHRVEASDIAMMLRKNIAQEFLVLRDVPALRRKMIPTFSELITRMDTAIERDVFPLRPVVDSWGPRPQYDA